MFNFLKNISLIHQFLSTVTVIHTTKISFVAQSPCWSPCLYHLFSPSSLSVISLINKAEQIDLGPAFLSSFTPFSLLCLWCTSHTSLFQVLKQANFFYPPGSCVCCLLCLELSHFRPPLPLLGGLRWNSSSQQNLPWALSIAAIHPHPMLAFFLSPLLVFFLSLTIIFHYWLTYLYVYLECIPMILWVTSSRRTEALPVLLAMCPQCLTQFLGITGAQQTLVKWMNELEKDVHKVRNCALNFLDLLHLPSTLEILCRCYFIGFVVKWLN